MGCGVFAYELTALLRAVIASHSVSISSCWGKSKNNLTVVKLFVRKVSILQKQSFRSDFDSSGSVM